MFRKSLLIASLLFGLIIVSLAGTLFYFYTHPDTVAFHIKKAVSNALDASIDIEKFTYSIRPMHFQAEGIKISPNQSSSGFSVHIPKMTSSLSLVGSFGRKTLSIDELDIQGLSGKYDKQAFHLARKSASAESIWRSLLQQMVALFLFQDIRIGKVSLTGGNFKTILDGPVLDARSFSIFRSESDRLELNSNVYLDWPEKGITAKIPQFHLSSPSAISLSDLSIKGRVMVEKMAFHSPEAQISDIDIKAGGNFDFKGAHLDLDRFTISIGKQINLKGSLDIETTQQIKTNLIIEESTFSPEYLVSLLPDRTKKQLPPMVVGGDISNRGTLTALREAGRWQWDYDLTLNLANNRFVYQNVHQKIGGYASGQLNVSGNDSQWAIGADLAIQESEFTNQSVKANMREIQLTLSGNHPIYQIKDASAAISNLKLLNTPNQFALLDAEMRISNGLIDIKENEFRFSQVHMRSPLFGDVEGMIESKDNGYHFRVESSEAPIIKTLSDMTCCRQDGR